MLLEEMAGTQLVGCVHAVVDALALTMEIGLFKIAQDAKVVLKKNSDDWQGPIVLKSIPQISDLTKSKKEKNITEDHSSKHSKTE